VVNQQVRMVPIPEELCSQAEQKWSSMFSSVEELLMTVLAELLQEDGPLADQKEQAIVEQRLKDLGYI
jgi:hypothetical protein